MAIQPSAQTNENAPAAKQALSAGVSKTASQDAQQPAAVEVTPASASPSQVPKPPSEPQRPFFDPGLLVPITAMVTFFSTIIIAIILTVLFFQRRHRMLHETLRLMIEKGTPIPQELLSKPNDPMSDLRKGILLTALGFSSVLYFLMNGFHFTGLWALGLIPLLAGIGYMVIWKLETKKEAVKE